MSRFTLLVTRGKPVVYCFDTLDQLAIEVYRLRWTDEGQKIAAGALPTSVHLWEGGEFCRLRPFNVEAFDGHAVLDVQALFRHGKNLFDRRGDVWFWRRNPRWNGEGPVPGTGRRIRGRKYFRYPVTQRDRRENCRPLEVDEPRVRAARNHHYLPSSWDDIYRRTERSWKVQGKRRKAWSAR